MSLLHTPSKQIQWRRIGWGWALVYAGINGATG